MKITGSEVFLRLKNAYEILVKFNDFKNIYFTPRLFQPLDNELCLGESYFSPLGRTFRELWVKKDFNLNEYFFSNNTETAVYNHEGLKHGFYVSKDLREIKYLNRLGSLKHEELSEWRTDIQAKSSLYFLGLQDVSRLEGSYSRRSIFCFDSNGKLILHYRTTDITAKDIKDYLNIRLGDYFKSIGEDIHSMKILAADGDHNAQTYIPKEEFSDQKLNSYGFHLLINNSVNPVDEKEVVNGRGQASNLPGSKRSTILNFPSIVSGFFRYLSSPRKLFERIYSNINLLILDYSNFNQQVYDIDLDQNETGHDFLINKETLSQIDKFKLINIKSSNKNLKVFIQDCSFALREIKGNHKTYNLILDDKTYFLRLNKFAVLEFLSVNETLGTKEYFCFWKSSFKRSFHY